MGDLPGGSLFWSEAYDISADGNVIVGYGVNATDNLEAFRWTSVGGMVPLGFLPNGNQSCANGTHTDGSVIVGLTSGTSPFGTRGSQAFRWTSSGGMEGLGIGLLTFGTNAWHKASPFSLSSGAG